MRTLEDRLLGLGRQEEKTSAAEAGAKEEAAKKGREKVRVCIEALDLLGADCSNTVGWYSLGCRLPVRVDSFASNYSHLPVFPVVRSFPSSFPSCLPGRHCFFSVLSDCLVGPN